MPVISFISPKGGAGKTTAATILATQLAESASVIMIDADKNAPLAEWKGRAGEHVTVKVVVADEYTMIDAIDEAQKQADYVIVDCDGSASTRAVFAVGSADLVIVPTQGSQLDAIQAARGLELVAGQEKQCRRKIPHRILLTRTNPVIKPRTLSNVVSQLTDAGIGVMRAQINEREAFRAIFSFGRGLRDLDPKEVTNIDKAQVNAKAFKDEVLTLLGGLHETQLTTTEKAA